MYTGFENPMMMLQKNHRYEPNNHNMYHTIHFKPKVYTKQNDLKRNCISMENLKVVSGGYNSNNNSLARSSKGKNKKSSNSNQCLNISNPMPMNNGNNMSSQYFHMPFGYIYDRIEKKNSPGNHKQMSTSKQSLGTNASSDDCFRYRDVAL